MKEEPVRLYYFDNGERLEMTSTEAEAYMKEHNTSWRRIIYGIHKQGKPINIDGTRWQPHFNKTLGKYFSSRREYDRAVKAAGLVEAGNEKPKFGRVEGKKTPYMSESAINYVRDLGVSLDEGTVRQINDRTSAD